MILLGLSALGCAFVALYHRILSPNESPLLWIVSVTGISFGLGCLGGAIRMSDHRIEFFWNRGLCLIERTKSVPIQPTSSILSRVFMIVGGLAFLLNLIWVSRHQDAIEDDDQLAYLLTAQEIALHGGPMGVWSDLWSGKFEESNRHPLYLVLLGISPTVEFGRALSIAISLTSWGLTGWIVRRKFGSLTAGLSMILLGTNGAWLFHSPRLVCEVLLTGLSGLMWLMFVPTSPSPVEERPKASISSQLSESTGLSLGVAWVTGVLAGLCYLTKGTGLLLVAGVVVAWSVVHVFMSCRWIPWIKSTALFSISVIVVTSPLLARNIKRFGSATYNVNSYLLWVDAYESPTALASQGALSAARESYLNSHSMGQIIQREVTGLAWETFIFLRSLGPAPAEDARVLFGIVWWGFGWIGLASVSRLSACILLAWTVLVVVTMAWYVPIAAGDRFVMPLLIPWLILAAEGHQRAIRAWAGELSSQRWLAFGWGTYTMLSVGGVWISVRLWSC